MTNKVTIYDVATAAGVSISTVSLALNTPERVTPATRNKVLLAADELGFVPKADAVTRARRGVGRIGVIAPFTAYPSFARRLNGVFGLLREHPLEVVVFDEQSAATTTSPLLASLPITGRLDGLIIMALPLDATVAERLRRQRLPTVLVDMQRDDFDCVSTDDRGGGELAAEHLVDRGHRRLGFIGERQQSQAYFSPCQLRLDGYRHAAQTRGASVPDDAVALVRHGIDEARRAAHELLERPEPPTAIFAHDDTLAAGVLRAARERGLSVPGDLAVVGFDDSELAPALDLTTVRQPFEESGRLGVRALLDRMSDAPAASSHTVLRLELIARGTT
jgi:DNA-binding LacI/PurR family transcriptional regulator